MHLNEYDESVLDHERQIVLAVAKYDVIKGNDFHISIRRVVAAGESVVQIDDSSFIVEKLAEYRIFVVSFCFDRRLFQLFSGIGLLFFLFPIFLLFVIFVVIAKTCACNLLTNI